MAFLLVLTFNPSDRNSPEAMRIGLDAVVLKKEIHGIGNYIKHLVLSLHSVAPLDDYLLVTTKSNLYHFQHLTNRVSLESCPASRPFRALWEQTILPGILQTKRVDVFHGLASVVPLRRSCRRVVTIHDLTALLLPHLHPAGRRSYLQWMIPQACRHAEAVITVSESTRDDLVTLLRVPREKIFVVHLGVDDTLQPVRNETQLLAVRRKYGLPEKYILYLGAIEPRKNLCTLLSAFQEATDVNKEFALVVAGSLGWHFRPLMRQAMSSTVRDRIIFPGYVSPEDLPSLYTAASLFVYPSLYEGFGLPVLEAMACGTPVITSNVSSLPEVAADAAVLVEPRSACDLANAMRNVLSHENVRKSLSDMGILRARRFTWKQTALKTRQVYEKLAG